MLNVQIFETHFWQFGMTAAAKDLDHKYLLIFIHDEDNIIALKEVMPSG